MFMCAGRLPTKARAAADVAIAWRKYVDVPPRGSIALGRAFRSWEAMIYSELIEDQLSGHLNGQRLPVDRSV